MSVVHRDAVREVARDWVIRLASGGIMEDEMQALRQWLQDGEHQRAFEAERSLWQSLTPLRDEFRAPAPASPTQAGHPSSTLAPRRKRRFRALAGFAVAASLVAGIRMADVPMRLRADVVTATGEIRKLDLADGSVAWLNSDSALAMRFDGTERRIDLLRGEAWFEVSGQPAPFRVYAADAMVEDISTAFSVRRAGDEVTVVVTEGKVLVQPAGGAQSAREVSAGEAASYRRGTVRALSGPGADISLAWRQGKVMFDSTPLNLALAEMDRHHRGRILLLNDEVATVKVSGVFGIDKLDQGLEGLAASQGLQLVRLTPYLSVLY